MTPQEWHSRVLALAYEEFARMGDPRTSQAILMFVKHGEVYTGIFHSDPDGSDEPSQADTEVSHRLGALQGTAAEAYATARLVIWNYAGSDQTWAISVSGAEAADSNESTWIQGIEFSDNGDMRRGETWAHDDVARENAINPWATP